MKYIIRKNGTTLGTTTANSAEEALINSGFQFTSIGENDVVNKDGDVIFPDNRVTDVIAHHNLDYTNYGTSYGFDCSNNVVAVGVREVTTAQRLAA